MSQRLFNTVAGVLGALALGAELGARLAMQRTCRSAEWMSIAITAGIGLGILVFGILLGRLLLLPNRTALLAALGWAVAISAAVWAVGARMFECFNT